MSRVDRGEAWRRTWVVALREIRERLGSRAYRLSTLLGMLLVIAIVVVPSTVHAAKSWHVGFAGSVPSGTVAALQMQADATGHSLRTTTYPTVAAGEQAVRDRRMDVLLVDGGQLEWRTRTDGTLAAALTGALQAVHVRDEAARLGISADQLGRLLVPVTVTNRTLGATNTGGQDAETVGLVAVGFLYVGISLYAGFVLTSVVQEKANRVAEVLLARMPAHEILTGKVLGVGAVGLLQLAAIGATALVTVAAMGSAEAPTIPGGVLAWTCVFFVEGYFLYSVLYAALGATTSRMEDAQAAVGPVSALMVLSYVAVLYAQQFPSSGLAIALSYFPPSAPVVMTYRVAVGAVPVWQLVTSSVLMVFAMWGLLRLAGRVYSGALLRFGGRVPLRELVPRRSGGHGAP